MGICGWLVLGGIAGWIAGKIAGTEARMGMLANILVGIVGASVGGFVFHLMGGAGVTGFNLYSLGVSVVGAVILLAIVKAVVR